MGQVMLAMWTLIVILGNIAVFNLPVLYLYILKGKLPFYLYFEIASLILRDQCVFLHCAPSVGKQREVESVRWCLCPAKW